ncbi:hypothetical protein PR202_gb12018 [Eleusine coracana subsp. coracana]|uniref:Disease resistance protein RPM1 n=1 Tax=Eleusine coracana subsp. coracana TaxID=191504 RepID=A0AAV5EPT5_ELECO|nr:hypothetical protein PR202_gb12018 [Eleusine coracana subsp. coracana]
MCVKIEPGKKTNATVPLQLCSRVETEFISSRSREQPVAEDCSNRRIELEMAESALSLARSVLGSAIGKMATAAAEEMSLLMGVQKEIWFMKDELKTMQAFLIAAEAMKNKKPLLKVWAEQVRSLSYDIEDCLDEFMVHVGSKSLSQQLIKLKDRHRIAVQIRNLKSRVEEVSSRNTRYNLIQIEDTEIDQALSYLEDVRNHSARNIDEAELVGTSTFKNNLLDKITAHYDDGHDRVICVVGMGGLGKTTLVRKIYESKEGIENKFPYRAWITVSQSLSRIDVLKGMIRQLFGDTFLETCLKSLDGMAAMQMQVDHLGKNLAEELKDKRYFVILDDLWDIGAWIWIRDICLPSTNNKANRIVITTRDASVAEACTTKLDCQPFILELKPLEKKHSIDLLLRKMRKSEQDMKNDEKLNTIVTKLVTKCGGLPLAIITIGAMFAAKHESEWDRLYTQLPAQLENNLSLEAIRSMIDAGAHGTTEWVDSVSSLPLLRSLTLTGHIGDKVDWFRNLTQLVKLRLEQSMLEEGKAVEILGALPNLMLLDLQPGAYVGKKLVFRQGAFRNLRKLHCRVVSDELIEIRFEQGASPQMESIEVDGHELKLGINGTKNLAKLKEISLGYDCKVARLGMLQEEVNTHPNRPVMRLYRDRSYHDLGDPEAEAAADEEYPAVVAEAVGRSRAGSMPSGALPMTSSSVVLEPCGP